MLRNKKMIISINLIVLTLLAVIIALSTISTMKKPNVVTLLSTLDSKSYFGDNSKNKYTLREIVSNKFSVIYLLSEDCKACMEQLNNIVDISTRYKNPHISHIFIWQNTVPIQIKEKEIMNYSLKGKINVSPVLPYIQILNDRKEIIFSSSNLNYIQKKLDSLIESEMK